MNAGHAGAGSHRFVEGTHAVRRPWPTLARRVTLALGTLALATLALAGRADAYVYWANQEAQTIGRANLDGTGVNQSFIPNATFPRAWRSTPSTSIG